MTLGPTCPILGQVGPGSGASWPQTYYRQTTKHKDTKHVVLSFLLTHIEKNVSLCNEQRSSVRPSGSVQKLNVGFFSETIVPSQIKLGMIITTIEFYADIPLFVTFDLYLGHRVSICAK